MSYIKNTWQKGDVVTAEKLNHMEAGIASAGTLIIHTDENDTMDKTWQEILDAMKAGVICLIVGVEEGRANNEFIRNARYSDGIYMVTTLRNDVYGTESADGYPVYGNQPVG